MDFKKSRNITISYNFKYKYAVNMVKSGHRVKHD